MGRLPPHGEPTCFGPPIPAALGSSEPANNLVACSRRIGAGTTTLVHASGFTDHPSGGSPARFTSPIRVMPPDPTPDKVGERVWPQTCDKRPESRGAAARPPVASFVGVRPFDRPPNRLLTQVRATPTLSGLRPSGKRELLPQGVSCRGVDRPTPPTRRPLTPAGPVADSRLAPPRAGIGPVGRRVSPRRGTTVQAQPGRPLGAVDGSPPEEVRGRCRKRGNAQKQTCRWGEDLFRPAGRSWPGRSQPRRLCNRVRLTRSSAPRPGKPRRH